ncbi:MAG: protein-glutamate O-methyltransferase CheR [Candidatus Eisenbacteria bacterium]|uniref:protein-glutamate O-methyltransferase n=1 Tax=Eiseniibacteriota bacterium TaxID=2212470 RepID=A0A948RZM0_UNCEI|nr:protein-glutamate O-methyltransferase CheR [Candidatus Eisenbacteria bacterium]MBU1949149.1 protein-glutamate O-methyltransferase CheR [Candidatus Eisenbacteria bacterium]MBU2692112.1 protein-glutamate O-methyltransferase CheR [Candidatus Eisenbacteria bacterium]
MPIKLKPDEFILLRDLIEKISCIRVGDGKAYLIESRLSKVLEEYKCESFTEFHKKVVTSKDADLLTKIVDAMSTQETLWFRDVHPFKIFGEYLLPQYAAEIKEGKRQRVKIWSAASSTGQEAYSISMTILEKMKVFPHLRSQMFEILATDIAPSALKIASNGLYDRIAMGRGLPPPLRERYFSDEGRYTRIIDQVKSFVTFKQLNLRSDFGALGLFDIILCRNVAIYFADDFKRDLYARIRRALAPHGHLILGSSESISAYSKEFDLMEFGGGIYYRAKSANGINTSHAGGEQEAKRKIA